MANYNNMANIQFRQENDPALIRLIEAEQAHRQDNTPTKTARDLVRERLAQLELTRDPGERPASK